MKKFILISILTTLMLTGCNQEQPQPNFQTTYLPEDWIIENGIYYSPEMYDAREGGPFSLGITINSDFSSINEYLEANKNCIQNKNAQTINNYPAVSFVNSCSYQNPKITLIEIEENLVEASSYSFSDESEEINNILNSLKIEG